MSARLLKEYKEAQTSKDSDIQLSVLDNLYKWKAYIQGPSGTPFEGGNFQVQLDVQENYPHQAPKARFITKVFHPNIHFRTGEVSLNPSISPLPRPLAPHKASAAGLPRHLEDSLDTSLDPAFGVQGDCSPPIEP